MHVHVVGMSVLILYTGLHWPTLGYSVQIPNLCESAYSL